MKRAAPHILPWLLLSLLSAAAFGKSAEEYFHGAAYKYIAGHVQEASVEANEGVREYPYDSKLRALAEQIDKMKDQQRQDQNPGGQKNPDKNKGQNPPNGNDPDQQKQDGKNPPDQGKNPDPNKNGQPPPKPQDGQGDNKNDDKNDGKNPGAPPPRAGQMSKDDAERLLNSFADEEKKEQAERRPPPQKRTGMEQDW